MSTVFTKIINREIPARIVYEDDKYIAIFPRDVRQLGHTLVIPKREVDSILDINDEETSAIFVLCKKLAKAIQSATNCKRVVYMIHGFEVPHLHIHLIPSFTGDDTHQDQDFSDAELDEMLNKIKLI